LDALGVKVATLSPVTPALAAPSQALKTAKDRWETAVAGRSLSFGSRAAEASYFLREMTSNWSALLLGSGGGGHITIETPSAERMVRGAHVTYVTLLYRHGIVLGAILIWFVAIFGLPKNIRQYREAEDVHVRILLGALISYRLAAAGIAVHHQGLFDDPLVFLSIAFALAWNPEPATTRMVVADDLPPINQS